MRENAMRVILVAFEEKMHETRLPGTIRSQNKEYLSHD